MALHGEDTVAWVYLPEMKGDSDTTNKNKHVQPQSRIIPLTRFVESSRAVKAMNLVSDLAVSCVFTPTHFTQGVYIRDVMPMSES